MNLGNRNCKIKVIKPNLDTEESVFENAHIIIDLGKQNIAVYNKPNDGNLN